MPRRKSGRERFGYRIAVLALEHLVEVVRIDRECDDSWTADEFRTVLSRPDTIGFVAVSKDSVAAFAVCTGDESSLTIRRIATATSLRRRKAASALIAELQARTAASERLLRMDVSDDSTGLQIFLRHHGFVGYPTVGAPVAERTGETYRFVWSPFAE